MFRRAHFEDDVGLRPERTRIRHDLGAGRTIGVVGEPSAVASAGLYRHGITELGQMSHCLWRGGDPFLARMDFPWNADFHVVTSSP